MQTLSSLAPAGRNSGSTSVPAISTRSHRTRNDAVLTGCAATESASRPWPGGRPRGKRVEPPSKADIIYKPCCREGRRGCRTAPLRHSRHVVPRSKFVAAARFPWDPCSASPRLDPRALLPFAGALFRRRHLYLALRTPFVRPRRWPADAACGSRPPGWS